MKLGVVLLSFVLLLDVVFAAEGISLFIFVQVFLENILKIEISILAFLKQI